MRTPTKPPVAARMALLVAGILCLAFSPALAQFEINEIRIDQPSGDTDEYFELSGTPGASLTGYTYVVIGDGAGACGTIEAVIDLTGQSIQADGLFVAAEGTASFTPDATLFLNFENSDNVTHMLVLNFVGEDGTDLDADDDGVLDATPWTSIIDAVGLDEGTTPDCAMNEYLYAATTVGPDGSFVPGHVYRCGADWFIGGFTFGTNDSPGDANSECTSGVPPVIDDVLQRPLLPTPAEAVTVSCTVTDADDAIASVTLFYQFNGGGFASTAMSNTMGDTYEGTIPPGILTDVVDYYVEAEDAAANTTTEPIDAPVTTFSYTVANETITSIADVHTNLGSLLGTIIMVQGQVFCPGNYQADGVNVSAYIQDGSNRGLNIFGTFGSTGFADLNDTGNIVKVSGTVTTFGTTVELTNYEVELVSSGNMPLSPAVQPSTADAALPSNEGTYIEATGVVTAIATTGGSNPAHNFTVDDCSGPLVIRVDDDLLPMTLPVIGDELTASGAGSTFASQGQILVCSASELTNNGPVGDVCPPILLSARIETTPAEVVVAFDESIDPTTGGTSTNYEVFETGMPGNTIAVSTAVVSSPDSTVVLTLAAPIPGGVSHTLRVNNVEDTNGNAVAANSTIEIFDPNIIEITEIMRDPSALPDSAGEWFEIRNIGGQTVDLDGWTIRDNDGDLHVINNGGPLQILPGEYRVLGNDATAMAGEGVTLFYEYTQADIFLSNSADELVLLDDQGREVDRVEWNDVDFPDPRGASMQWTETGDNNDGSTWVGFGPVFGSGDQGTPGAANSFVLSDAPPQAARRTALHANRPNPFNPATTFSFTLKVREHVSLKIYNVSGELVRTVVEGVLDAGRHSEFTWDGTDNAGRRVTSGTYIYRLNTASGHTSSRKMTVLK